MDGVSEVGGSFFIAVYVWSYLCFYSHRTPQARSWPGAREQMSDSFGESEGRPKG